MVIGVDAQFLSGWRQKMTGEEEWVKTVAERIQAEGQLSELDGISVRVGTGAELGYKYKTFELEEKGASKNRAIEYQTDLLLYDQLDPRRWIPRVVIECALGEVTSDDILVFSAQAARHKHAQTYLRCGVLIGSKNLFSIPAIKMFRHGDRFDFMARWSDGKPSEAEWALFAETLKEEVQRSRTIQELFSADQDQTRFSIMHRQLSFQ
jgi:hypothetical protein